MANIIDILVAKQAQNELDKSLASLKSIHEEIISINQKGLKINSGASPKNPQQMNQSVKDSIALTAQLTAEEQKLLVATNRLESLKQKQIQTQIKQNNLDKQTIDIKNKEAVTRERNEKAIAREEQKLLVASNAYNKLQAELNKLTFAYQNLATRQAQGATLTKAEADQMAYLEKRIQSHDKTLKAVDASMGKYQRNVGNYASGFNPLSNSINQLGREMPAFANSVQTGFMAISNNLPIFFDAMGQVIAQNKQLQAEGKPTKSVLSQLASSLFSFQTLLSVGVTLLTLYGKEIVEWATGLSTAEKALRSFKDAQIEIQSQSVSQAKDLDKYRDVVNDTTASEKERNRALKLLKEQIPELSKVELEHADAIQQVNKYTDYYIKQAAIRYKADGFIKKAGEELIKQEEIRLKIQKDQVNKGFGDYIKGAASAVASGNLMNTSTFATANALGRLNKEFEASVSAQKEYEKSAEVEIRQLDLVNNSREKKIKTLKAEKDLVFDLVDVYASMFELNKLFLEREIRMYDELANSEHETLDDRLRNFSNYTNKKLALEILEYNENVRLQKQSYNDEVENLTNTYNEYVKQDNVTRNQRVKARTELNKALKALTEKNNLDLQILEIKHSDNIVEINAETLEKIAKLRELYSGLEFNKKIKDQELKDLLEHKNRLANIDKKTTQKQLDEISKSVKEDNKKRQEEVLQNDIANINKKLSNTKLNAEAEIKLKTELYEKQKALNQLEIADLEDKKKAQEDYLKLLDSTYSSFINDFASNSGFGKSLDILNGGLEKFKGDAAATALTVSEAFQEAFNTISQASQSNSDAEYSRLEQQKNISLQFAGESSTAREEIERQYEEKRKAIARREAEAQKRLAIFNIAVNTAQAIVAAVAKSPLTFGLPFSAIAAGIGAAQIAFVSSQQIPQFWKGTDNAPEGWAWTQEKGAEVITDKKGNIKTLGNDKGAQLTYLNKGDKVYKSHDDYINKTLISAGISPLGSYSNFSKNNSLSTDDFNAGISKLAKSINSNKPNNTQVFLNNKQINTDYFKGQKV